MRGQDGASWPVPHQAVLAGVLAIMTMVLLTAMGGDARDRAGTTPGLIEASSGPILATPQADEARPGPVETAAPAPFAAVVDGSSVSDTGVAVAADPAVPWLPAPGPAVPTTRPAAGPDTTVAPVSQSSGASTEAPAESSGATAQAATTSRTTAPRPSTTTTTSTTVAEAAGPVRTPGVETEVVPLTNGDRTAQGLTALSRHACLDSAASGFAEQLARTGVLAHNPGAGSAVTGCRPGQAWGDNVGTSAPCSASLLEEKWMTSAGHRRNILTPAFRYIGVGAWTDAAGSCWVQVLFSS